LIPLSCFGPEAILSVYDLLRGGIRQHIQLAGVTALIAIIFGIQVFPIKNNQWKLDSVYGFGFRSRKEIREAAGAVRAESGPNEVIIAPPEVAVEAGRRELVHYREIFGPMKEIERIWDSEGFAGLGRESRKDDFFRRLADLAPVGGEEALRAIEGEGDSPRRVRVVVPDSRKSLLSEFRILPDRLIREGFTPVYKGEIYTVWSVRSAARSAPAK
jgi:hypothetical protein